MPIVNTSAPVGEHGGERPGVPIQTNASRPIPPERHPRSRLWQSTSPSRPRPASAASSPLPPRPNIHPARGVGATALAAGCPMRPAGCTRPNSPRAPSMTVSSTHHPTSHARSSPSSAHKDQGQGPVVELPRDQPTDAGGHAAPVRPRAERLAYGEERRPEVGRVPSAHEPDARSDGDRPGEGHIVGDA
jgi:hypothetical protein